MISSRIFCESIGATSFISAYRALYFSPSYLSLYDIDLTSKNYLFNLRLLKLMQSVDRVVFVLYHFLIVLNLGKSKHKLFNNRVKILKP